MQSPPPHRIVVVGAGVAGERCALELRACGFDGSVTLVGAEPRLPYDRTLLSKEFLEDDLTDADIAFGTAEDYQWDGIELCLGVAATRLDAAEHRLRLADGRALRYDRLVVATGARPSRPAGLGAADVHVLRDVVDADRLRAALRGCRRLVVIGGGFVGCEVAATAASRGVRVTLLVSRAAPLAAVLGPEVARIGELHRAHGVDVRPCVRAIALRRAGDGGAVVGLSDGTSVAADVVVVGTGITSEVSWLPGAGTADGVVTDEFCRTEVPDVLAAGDCASSWHPRYRTWTRAGHWETAASHGAAAARNALDAAEPFAPVPFFWSCQYGVRFQWVRHAPRWDSVDIAGDASPESFVAHYRRAGRTLGVLAAGQPRVVAAARRELEMEEAVA
jgi:NADPH-dependent 2,4-dienoyl-CoA reductase/sulfur reductase-like enzyme